MNMMIAMNPSRSRRTCRRQSHAAMTAVFGAGVILLTLSILTLSWKPEDDLEGNVFDEGIDSEVGNGAVEKDEDSEEKSDGFFAGFNLQLFRKAMMLVGGNTDNKDNEYTDQDIVDESDDDYDYEYDNANPEFKEGDFDLVPLMKKRIRTEGENATEMELAEKIVGNNLQYNVVADRKLHEENGESSAVVDGGIFWSKAVEEVAPKGSGNEYVHRFLNGVRKLRVVDVQPPSWNRCGRPKNQFVTMSDGSHMCARYRYPDDYLIQGEVMSFYLARLLGITNVPIVVLSQMNASRVQWSDETVRKNVTSSGWTFNGVLALIQWIEDLERDRMPDLILEALRKRENVSVESLQMAAVTGEKLVELMQWSDLVVFDYITGNYDRVASMQDAADKENRPSILGETIHNLVKSRTTKSLWLIDNESGLVDAYSLIYGRSQPGPQADRFLTFHREVLATMCIFRRVTYEAIRRLHRHGDAAKLLVGKILRTEPLFALLPDLFGDGEFGRRFQQRINQVYRHMQACLDDVSKRNTGKLKSNDVS